LPGAGRGSVVAVSEAISAHERDNVAGDFGDRRVRRWLRASRRDFDRCAGSM